MTDDEKLKQIRDLIGVYGLLEPAAKKRSDALLSAIERDGFHRCQYLWKDYFGVEAPLTLESARAAIKRLVFPIAKAELRKEQSGCH